MKSLRSLPAARYAVLALWALGVVWAAAWLRFSDLERQPFHADEAATGAQTLAYRLDASEYQFDPKHRHGPMLTALAEPWCRLKGETAWESLEAKTLRQAVAACGLLAALGALALGMGMGMGWPRTLIAAGLAATSPLLVYYSRVFIHEPVFLFFAIPALAGLLLLLKNRHPWLGACALGIGAGAMAATRETVVVSLFAWGVAGLLFAWREYSRSRSRSPSIGTASVTARRFLAELAGRLWKPLLVAALLTLAIIFWFYTSGGRRPSGFLAFFTTYFEYDTGEGHDKPFGYYLELLALPKHLVARWWSEAGVLLLALCVYLDRQKNAAASTGRFLLEAGLLHLLVFSLIAYKTPWLASLGWLHLCFAGGFGGVALVQRFSGWARLAPVLGILLITIWQGVQARRAAFRLAADGRNPYAYVPTSRDVEGLAAWLDDLRAALPDTREEPLAVIGDEYWPLPWYLRQAGPTGYWSTLPQGGARLPVLLVMPSVFEESSAALADTHTFIPRGLRDEVPVMVAVRNDLWKVYQAR